MKVEATDGRAHPEGASISRWVAPDGWALRRIDLRQDAVKTPRGSLLFASGRGDFIEKYLEPLGHWHDRGWNVASFDWRGQGDSRGDIIGGHLDSFDPLVADGAALLADWMASTPGPHVAVGHSMGGHLLLRIVAEHRPALSAAVLVAPMIGINASPVPHWLGRLVARALVAIGWSKRRAWKDNERPAPPGSSRQAFLTSCPVRYSDEGWWHAQQPGFRLGAPTWGWMDAAFRSIDSLTAKRMAGIATPTLLLGTQRDRLVSPTAIKHAARLLPNAQLHMFRDAAHELLRESDPIRLEVLARIDEFLDTYAPA